MKIESITIKNFRCFGAEGITVGLGTDVTAFVGGNGSGKTAVFQALSRLFGLSSGERSVRRRDFHVPAGQEDLESGASLSIEVIFSFPGLDHFDFEEDDAVAARAGCCAVGCVRVRRSQ